MEPSATYCPLPWLHICTHPTGRLKLCCEDTLRSRYPEPAPFHIRDGLKPYLDSPYLAWVKSSMLRGERLEECSVCYRQEALGLHSKRQHEIAAWGLVSGESRPVYMDLKLGNRCNLQCVMCDPSSSSRLAAEYRELGWDSAPPFHTGQMGLPTVSAMAADFNWPEEAGVWQTLLDELPHLRRIKFTGGEPLLSPHLPKLLRQAAELAGGRRLRIQIVSNATLIDDSLLRLLGQFDLDLAISLDGVGKVNDFVRYPSRWESIAGNLELIRRHGIAFRINSTCSLVNMLYLTDLIEFNEWIGGPRITFIPVQSPEILDPAIAPPRLVQAARARLDAWRQRSRSGESGYYYERLERMLRGARYDAPLFDRFLKYLSRLARHRSMPLGEYLPELAELLDAAD